MNLRKNSTPYGAAVRIANELCVRWDMDPRYVLALSTKEGGDIAGLRAGMTCPSFGSGHTYSGAEVCIEEGPYEWTIKVANELNEQFEAEGLDLFCEPATSYALSIHRG